MARNFLLFLSFILSLWLTQLQAAYIPASLIRREPPPKHLAGRAPWQEFTEKFVLETDKGERATADAFSKFIKSIRDKVVDPDQARVGGVPMLPTQTIAPALPTEFFEVQISVHNNYVTLRLRRDNLYVVGFRPADSPTWYEFVYRDPSVHLIRGSTQLPFGGSYPELVAASGLGASDQARAIRAGLVLNRAEMHTAVDVLGETDQGRYSSAERARRLLVLVQMMAESCRLTELHDYIYGNWEGREALGDRRARMETSWGTLSTDLRVRTTAESLTAPIYNALRTNFGVTNVQALAGLVAVCLAPVPGRNRVASAGLGSPMLQILWIEVVNIDNEDPGDLYGSVSITDSLGFQYIFNRPASNYQSVRPGKDIDALNPFWPFSAAGGFYINFDLWDYDADLSPNDRVAQGSLNWSPSDPTLPYDKVQKFDAEAEYGHVQMTYIVMSNGVAVHVEVVLDNGDNEDPADVYGTITATTSWGSINLFNLADGASTGVRPGYPIPLARSNFAMPADQKVIISANLWDHDTLSPDDEIAVGSFSMSPLVLQSSENVLYGRYGKVRVRLTWN